MNAEKLLREGQGEVAQICATAAVFLSVCCLITARAEQNPAANSARDGTTDEAVRFLMSEGAAMRGIPFADVIHAVTGTSIRPVQSGEETDQRVLKEIGTALDEVVRRMSAPDSPVQSFARINEVSGPFENMLRDLLNAAPGLSCDFPRTAEDKVQRSGYPDLRLVDKASGRIYYLDPKLYAAGSRDSSFRTFYFEPKVATNKVREDAVHLILGFEHEARKAGHWNFTRWDIVDLSHFKVRLKAEFQGSNRDMYRPEAIVATSAK
jgi:hypothetical protein